MREFRTKAIINASSDEVWKVITDIKSYPKFDPNCIKIEGDIAKGESILIMSKVRPNRVAKMRVSQIEPNEIMVWESGWPFNLFKSVRTFTVIAKDDQTTEFHMVETFDGHLFNLLSKTIPDMTEAFNSFSTGLKRFIESRP